MPVDLDRVRPTIQQFATAKREINSANGSGTPPFNYEPIGNSSTAIGLQAAGQPQTLTALAFGSPGCSAATTGSLRAVVVELG